MKRLVVLPDMHCGHWYGLTPKSYQYKLNSGSKELAYKANIQKQLYDQYLKTIKKLQPIDIVVVNGDAVDGEGKKSGGTELITSDSRIQCNMAIECIKACKADTVFMTYGTPYHTGQSVDFEEFIAERLNCKIKDTLELSVNGVIFNFKHHIGRSLPAMVKEVVSNRQWVSKGVQKKADIIVRSHTHEFMGLMADGCTVFRTPALQGYGSKFGARRCTGKVDIGLMSFNIQNNGDWSYKVHSHDIRDIYDLERV